MATANAMRDANRKNLQGVQETNQANRVIAREANEYNYRMFQESNAFSERMWNLQNEYNTPANQKQRLIEAGINPLWAMSDVDNTSSGAPTSASASPAAQAQMQAPHFIPEDSGVDLDRLNGVANNMANLAQGMYKLSLDGRDVSTRERAQATSSMLQVAQAGQANANTNFIQSNTSFNLDTYSSRVQQEAKKVSELNSRINSMDKQSEVFEATKQNLEEQKTLIREQVNQVKASVDQGWEQLRQNARSLDIEQGKLNIQSKQYDLAVKDAEQRWTHASNQDMLQYMVQLAERVQSGSSTSHSNQASFGLGLSGSSSGVAGMPSPSVSGGYSGTDSSGSTTNRQSIKPADLANAEAMGLVFYNRAQEHPEDAEAQKAYFDYCRYSEILLQSLQQPITNYDDLDAVRNAANGIRSNAQSFSVLNP